MPTTLILALANRDFAVLVSDRRVTENGKLVDERDDERNKAGVLITRDARVAFAFTGLARYQSFNTEQWLLETLTKSAAPEFMMWPLVGRLAQRAREDIGALNAHPRDKKLSVLLLGYCYEDNSPRAHFWRLSNFEGGLGDEPSDVAAPEFTLAYGRDKQEPTEQLTLGIAAGATVAIEDRQMNGLHALLHAGRPAQAVVGKAVDVLREAALAPESKGVISQQCTSIVLPSDPTLVAMADYHAGSVTRTLGGVAHIEARGGPMGTWIVKTDALSFCDSNGASSLIVPKVGRNEPCPCGTGKKYKHCHGA